MRSYALTAMRQKGPVEAWIVDDTGFPKKGRHSVGVARQYCGQVGKQENCRVAVSLSVSTIQASLPIAWRLYLPHEWADDQARRKQAGVPEEIQFETKPADCPRANPRGVEQGVPASAGVGGCRLWDRHDSSGRRLAELELPYVVGIMSSVSVWKPGEAPLSKTEWKGIGRPTKLLRRDRRHQPMAVKELAHSLPASAWKTVTWRQGQNRAFVRASLQCESGRHIAIIGEAEPHPEEWL